MKSIRSFSLFKLLLLFVGAIGSFAIPAQAQSATGTFTLAHKVRWGGAVLPPGDYRFSLDSQNSSARVTVRELNGPMVAILLPQVMTSAEVTGASRLVLHEEGGESVVSELRLKDLDVTLGFTSPKLATVGETATLAPVAGPQPR